MENPRERIQRTRFDNGDATTFFTEPTSGEGLQALPFLFRIQLRHHGALLLEEAEPLQLPAP